MRLYEHEAKKLLASAGIATPTQYALITPASGPDGVDLAFPAIAKAQVLTGGRGKAGGILRVGGAAELAPAINTLFGADIAGHRAERILLEEAVEFSAACYLGVTMNPYTARTLLLASAEGGVEIEQLAKQRPEAVFRVECPLDEDPANEIEAAASFLAAALDAPHLQAGLRQLLRTLLDLYIRHDATLIEVNPLFVTNTALIAADAKVTLDNNALFRQRALLDSLGIEGKRHDTAEATEREKRAASEGFTYVDLLPEGAPREDNKVYVGLVPGGAGYGIFAIDEVTNIGRRIQADTFVPLNFMDSGGGPTRDAVRAMFALLFDHPLCDLVITSRFGGISSCDTFIRGLVDCMRARDAAGQRLVPVYGRMVGTDLAAARQYLEQARAETPDALRLLHMQVGNERIMARVIRDALAAFLAGERAQ